MPGENIRRVKEMKNINIDEFGDYRLGLTSKEIDKYLKLRTGKKNIKTARKKFDKISGLNTVATTSTGEYLMYRHDVERFFKLSWYGIPTHFD